MGWDAGIVDNKLHGKAIYYDNEGQEHHISDETAKRYLAQQDALTSLDGSMQETSNNINALVSAEAEIISKL
jgi:hypothetical protein